MLELYDYFRSSASYRARIVLSYKNIPYNRKEIHLVNNGGEQHTASYKKINPQGLVPSLIDQNNNFCLTQSLAIIEYLEEVYPQPSLLPKDPFLRAESRSLAYIFACDVHPLNNLRVLNYLKENFQRTEEEILKWYHYWLIKGLSSFEIKIQQYTALGQFSLGESFSLADVCLIPQVYNSLRYKLPMTDYPRIMDIYKYCLNLEFIMQAKPE
ncbi:MAG: maleylacetoacetate isomerase [Gammaproteobacteria bacterium]|nr:maleylacetoacetate isomerase [Gammaproteobacteria bacterium]